MRFAILGYAKIAREHLIPAILEAGHEVEVIAQLREWQESDVHGQFWRIQGWQSAWWFTSWLGGAARRI